MSGDNDYVLGVDYGVKPCKAAYLVYIGLNLDSVWSTEDKARARMAELVSVGDRPHPDLFQCAIDAVGPHGRL